jgi:hypothetical protein
MAIQGRQGSYYGASRRVFPITPDDANDLQVEIAELAIAVGGAVRLKQPGKADVTVTLPSGRFAMVVERIYATGTTATGLTGFE